MGHVNDKGVIKFELTDSDGKEFLVIFDAHENKLRITNKVSRPKAAKILYDYLRRTQPQELRGFYFTFTRAFQNYDSKNEMMLALEKGLFWVEKFNNIGLWVSDVGMFGKADVLEKLSGINFSKELTNRIMELLGGAVDENTIKLTGILTKVSPEELQLVRDIFGYGEIEALRSLAEWGGTKDKVIQWYSYLVNNKHFNEVDGFRRCFRDYLQKIEQLEEENLYPKNFFESYALLIIRHRAKQDEIKSRDFVKQQNRFPLAFEDDTYTVFVPQTIGQVHNEGEQQRNCVAGYADEVIRGRIFLVFIRKKDKPEKSLITVELSTWLEVRQVAAFSNQPINNLEDRAFLEKYKEYLRTIKA